MAKKNYSKIEAEFVPNLEDKNGDQTTVTFFGRNTHGTEQKITIDVYDWMFPEMVKRMKEIISSKISTKSNINERIKNIAAA